MKLSGSEMGSGDGVGRGGKVRENTILTGFQNTSVARLGTSRLVKLGEIVESLGSQHTQRESISAVDSKLLKLNQRVYLQLHSSYIKNGS